MLMEKSELRKGLILKNPQIHKTAFTATGSRIIGDVILKEDSSIWYNTVARADINQIIIGKRSNIQDNSVIHLENDQGVIVGDDVTVGHNAIIHGCTIQDGALIGMGAIIMNGALIGRGAVIGAGGVIKENMIVPDLSLVVGIPGKIKKTLTEEEQSVVPLGADHYIDNYKKYKQLAHYHEN